MKTLHTNLVSLILLLIVTSAAGQSITGSTSVYPGMTTQYTYDEGSPLTGVYWTAVKGSVISSGTTGLTGYTASVTWSSTGSGYVRIYASDGQIAQLNVTVNACSVGSASSSGGSRCGAGTVSLTGTPGSNGNSIRWYSASTGGTLLHTGTSYTTPSISSSTNYYMATYNTTTTCESTSRVTVTASVSNTGSISPVTANAFNSYSATHTLSGHTGTILRWEKNVNSGGWTTISNTSSTYAYSVSPVVTTSTTLLRAVLNNACGNPSYSAQSTVTVYPNPSSILVNGATPPTSTVYSNYGYSVTLSIPSQAYYASYQWKLNGNNVAGATSNSHLPTAAGVYTVMVTLSGGASYTTAGITVVLPTSQRDSVNTVSRTVFVKSGVNPGTSRYTLAPAEFSQGFAYTDGMGRVVQQVGVGQSPSGGDIIVPNVYGKQGVVDSAFLPYATSAVEGRFRKDAIRGSSSYTSYTSGQQYLAYQGTAKVASDTKPYGVSVYTNTPDQRIKEQGAPGADWQPGQHSVQAKQRLSTTSYYPVRRWKSNGTTNDYYPDNTIWSNVVTDENGNTKRTYTDKRGLLILSRVQEDAGATQWLDTYYVYDDYGQLIMQIPPKAVQVLGSGTSLDANSTSVAELVFKYTYDNRGRLTQKKVPGSAPQDIVYDKFDRIVLTQDANQRTQNTWMFVKYDEKNRKIYSGTMSSSSDRATLQGQFDAIDYNTQPYFETPAVNATYQGYTNVVFPTTNLTVLQAFYYDTYDFDRNGSADYNYDNTHLSGIPSSSSSNTRGLPTGSKTKRLDNSDWLISCLFYDNLDRPIQVRSNNAMNATVADKTSILYFANNLSSNISKLKVTQVGASTIETTQRYTYDNNWRPTAIYHTITGGSEIQVVGYEYNALGQLVSKKLHVSGTPLQTVDMRYNIRGWLTSINNARLVSDAGVTNNDTDDYFGMELLYNGSEGSGLGNTARYDGTISAIKWKSGGMASGTADQRSYKYSYDNSGRLLSGTFQAYSGSSWNVESNTLNETMTYDKNGNILTLVRNQNQRGLTGTTVTSTASAIDNLTYTYSTTNQNRLLKVADASANTAGFSDGVNVTSEYRYDTLGSMTIDRNKGITSVTYNHMGKPKKVIFANGDSIGYTYWANGTRIKTVNTISGVSTSTVELAGSIYVNNVLKYFASPEGRVVKNGSAYEYQYFIKDHLGNNRVVFSSATPTGTPTTATFEGDAGDQQGQYLNVNQSHVVSFTAANHTPSGIKVVRMNQTYSAGPSWSKKVVAGDKVDMEVYAYYEATSGWGSSNTAVNTMITAIAGAFGGVSGGGGESGNIFSGVNSAIGGFGLGANQGDTRPTAFLNYILFDKNYKVMDMGWSVVPTSANFAKQKVSIPQVTVKEAGYIFVYLSYESQSNTYVYFDDFKVTYTPTNIVQSNEYYPFGMQTANSWTRENALGNDYLANGGTKLNTQSGLYDLDFRNFDPVLGRLNQVDPMADVVGSFSPYAFSRNNPVSYNDPSGLLDRYNISGDWADVKPGDIAYGRIGPMQGSSAGWAAGGAPLGNSGYAGAGHNSSGPETLGLANQANDGWVPDKVKIPNKDYTGLSNQKKLIEVPTGLSTYKGGGLGQSSSSHVGKPRLGEIPLKETIIELFGASFQEEWLSELQKIVESGSPTLFNDVLAFVQEFDYSKILSTDGKWTLNLVEDSVIEFIRYTQITGGFDPYAGYGSRVFSGDAGEVSSGELTGQGLLMFQLSNGYTLVISIVLEVSRKVNL